MIGIAGAVGANALLLAALLTMHGDGAVAGEEDPGFAAIVTASLDPPPPPEPDAVEEGAAAEPSRGDTAEPSRPEPERPLPDPTPAQPAPDAGAGAARGAGAAAGSGTGGDGTGTGSGEGGGGRGSGTVTPPVRIAGALTDADYRRARPPEGARGTVVIGFTVTAGGQVEGCRVERSSGYPVLDSATCRLVSERFRFRPARDAGGRAIAWTLRTDFTWVPR